MEKLSGAQMVIRALEDEGVDHIFGYPGGAVIDIYDALYNSHKIKHILVRHEQSAAHAADGYARATGRVGVCLVTSGPGATNTVTGIATAYMDSVPIVVITGQVATKYIGQDAFQEVDTIGITRPIVKHSFLCKSALDIPVAIKKAFYIASTGRPGPVVIDIPKDCQSPKNLFDYEYPKSVSMRSYNPTLVGHKGQVKRAAKVLAGAQHPVMLIGGGTIISNASAEVKEVAERFNMPVTSTLMGLGAFPATDGRFLGMLGMHGTYEANMTMHNSDVILAVGTRFADRITNNVAKFCPNAKIIHIDVDPTSIAKTVRADIPIVGSCEIVLSQLLEAADELGVKQDSSAHADWWSMIDGWRGRHCLAFKKDPENIKPQEVIEELWNVTGGKCIVCSDVGQHQMFIAQHFKFDRPRQWLNSGGLGTMGYGFPAAIGAQIALPDEKVCVISGDGSFQMNSQELSTCLQYHLPLKIIIMDNKALGNVKQWQDMFYGGRHSETILNDNPDFVKLAEAYGHVGMRILLPSELHDGLAEAFSDKYKDRLVLIDIRIDPEEKVFPMQLGGGAMCDIRFSETETTETARK